MTTSAPERHEAIIVGTGFAGIAMAIRLRQDGVQDVILLEKADDLGGTWRDNRYPGCACDVPSNLYSYSFAPKPDWDRAFAEQPQIWDYLREVASRFGVDRLMRFSQHVTEARYDEKTALWHLRTSAGDRYATPALVLATGALSTPSKPHLPGLESFSGTVFHSAEWPDGDDGLTERRVAVIGTGASAVQFVPAIAPRTKHVTVFQRTAPWILPKLDRHFSQREQLLYERFPMAQKLVRAGVFTRLESRVLAFTAHPRAMEMAEKVALRHLERQVSDPELRRKLRPDYRIGCKRILLSNDYWRTFERDDVTLVTDGVSRIERGAVVDGAGRRHEVEAIVLGTGFRVTEPYEDLRITGVGGRTLAEAWRDGMEAYLGVAVAGFPNMFLLVGPNSGLGHSSMVFMIERQVEYVIKTLRLKRARGAQAVAVRGEAQRRFVAEMDRRSSHTVWTSGCKSWYLDRFGRNRTLWPASVLAYWRRMRQPQEHDLVLQTGGTRS
ncbi:MAG TPA: NAD(P)/FAD-dependent oxidoreductase [Actinomycetales bacterium]|nr:NAD(P)/FAD-dependent oxidoreductase [Actinomycetales bacterium]